MRKLLYPRLALNSMRRFSDLSAISGSLHCNGMMFYIILFLGSNSGLERWQAAALSSSCSTSALQ